MKYSLMSMGFSNKIKTKKPNFLDILRVKGAGLKMADEDITFDDIKAFYNEKGIPFQERTMEFEDFVALAKDAGYDGIDCMNYTVELPGAEVKALLDKYGLKFSCYNIVVRFNNARSDEDIKAIFEREVKPGIDVAAEAGADYVLIMPTHIMQDLAISREKAYENIVKGLRLCVAYAAEKGITLTTETLQAIQVPYCSNAEMRRVLDAVPELTYTHDTGNLLPSLEKAEEAIDMFKDRLVGLHMKDFVYGDTANMFICSNGKYLVGKPYGEGMVDFETIYKKLNDWGFDGWIAFEGATRGSPAIDLEYFKGIEKKTGK